MVSYVPNSAPWAIWFWAPREVAEVWKERMHRRHQEIKALRNTFRLKEGGKGYWQRCNCFRNIPALVSMRETYNTNPPEKTGSIESPPELSIYNTNTSLTLLQLKEGVMLIQNTITALLEKQKTISQMLPSSFIVTAIFSPDYFHSRPM